MSIEEAAPLNAPARASFIERLTAFVALLGGLVSLSLALIVVTSVFGRWLFNTPVEGDFEFVKMGTAMAVYSFLPYGQAKRVNIVVDTFTGGLSARTRAIMDASWDLVYAAGMGVLTYCLINGALDYIKSGETTMQLQLVIWPAIVVCAMLSGLLTIVALTTAVQLINGRSQPSAHGA